MPAKSTEKKFTVGDILTPAAEAFGLTVSQLMDRIERWLDREAREGFVTKRTWQDYKKDRLGTRVNLDFALAVRGYLDRYHDAVKDQRKAEEARDLCVGYISPKRRARFEKHLDSSVYHQTGKSATPSSLSGLYVICRFGTSTGRFCQELLILRDEGERQPRMNATLICHDLVLRGIWHILDKTIYSTVYGYRAGRRPHSVNALLCGSDDEFSVLGGILSGITSAENHPVTLPVIAVRMKDVDPATLALGDETDEFILRRFNPINNSLGDDEFDVLKKMAPSMFAPQIITATHPYVASLNGLSEDALVIPAIAKFCRGDTSG